MRALSFLLLVGCGRFHFDAHRDDGGNAAGDGATDATLASDAMETGGDGGTPDLLVWLRFEENPQTGIVNHGSVPTAVSCVTTCPTQMPGIDGNGFSFNGTSDALRIADRAALRTASGTLAAYVWLRSVPPENGYGIILGRAFTMTGQNTWELFFLTDASGSHLHFGGDASGSVYSADPWSTTGAWRHVAATWSPAQQQLFVDGVLRSTAANFTAIYDNHDIIVGADEEPSVFAWFFDGIMDDLRVYDRVLTQPEIATLVTQ